MLKRRVSQSDGSIKTHKMEPDLTAALGQGTLVVFHGKVHTMDANSRVVFRVTHGGLGDELPSSEGFVVATTGDSTTRTATGGFRFQTSGDLLSDVEVEADVDNTVGGNEVGLDFELWATVVA